MSTKKVTILSRVGGKAALDALIEEFYFRLLCDEELLFFFQGVDMHLLKVHQKRFMTLAFTEIPKELDVSGMIKGAHWRLFQMGLNEKHFDTVAGHLVETLQVLEVPQDLIEEIIAVVGPLRPVFEENGRAYAAKKQLEDKDKAHSINVGKTAYAERKVVTQKTNSKTLKRSNSTGDAPEKSQGVLNKGSSGANKENKKPKNKRKRCSSRKKQKSLSPMKSVRQFFRPKGIINI